MVPFRHIELRVVSICSIVLVYIITTAGGKPMSAISFFLKVDAVWEIFAYLYASGMLDQVE